MLLCQQKEGDSNGYYINRRLEFKKSNESFIIKKRIISTIIASILLISVFPVVSFAATVNLIPSDYEAFSNSIQGKSALFYGRNKETSNHMVYFESQYSRDGVSWFQDKTRYIHIGEDCPLTVTTSWADPFYWRLRLNPTGAYKNCAAYGYIGRDT